LNHTIDLSVKFILKNKAEQRNKGNTANDGIHMDRETKRQAVGYKSALTNTCLGYYTNLSYIKRHLLIG